MAEAAVGATIEYLLEKLLTLAKEQISLVRHFKDDLEKLGESLTMVQAFLHDAEKKKVTNSAVKVWLRQLEDLSFDADNVIDDIDYILLSKQVKKLTTNKTVKKKVQSLLSCSSPILFRQKMGTRIKVINEKLQNINQRARDFGLQSRFTNAQDSRLDEASGDSWETSALSKDRIFFGRENEMSEIVKMLITTTPSGQNPSVLPIVGMGGQGKTTFARKVFHDETIISHFGDKNRVWVYVSQNFDVRNILKNILTSLKEENVPDSKEALLQKLQKHLGEKIYLLVLDDVWNEDREKWDDFVNSLLGISSPSNGYCMIVTTRSEEVASIVEETLPVHKLKGLPEDDCWSIIKAKAFRVGETPSEFIVKEVIGKNIAKKCQGLPLAANVVGGLLSSMKSKDEWSLIEKSWVGNENPISNALKLSFYHLAPSLRKCFAYCAIFPKGYEIEKERLVELWMAEGFLQPNHQNGNSNIDMETIGSNNFNILMRNSLLQHVRSDDYDNVTHCSMHDLVHDLACSVLYEGVCKSRYIGYKPGGDGLSSIPKGQEGYVRTLFFDGKVSDIKFSDFESLHTLTFVGEDTYNLPTSIKELKHLRYLDISKTKIRCLPDSIGELYHLQTFRSPIKLHTWGKERSCLKNLPDSLSYLISLRHLHIPDDTTLPREIGKLTSLQTLPHFHVGGKKGCKISELGKLKDLKGKLEIRNLGNFSEKTEAVSANLIGKSGLYKIKLVWDGSYREGGEHEANDDESVLEGLEPHQNLKKIEIGGYKGKSLPLWTSNISSQLAKIKLMDCSEVEEVPSLGQLPNLKSLKMCNLTNVKSIGPSFYGKDKNIFRALKWLELAGMKRLKEWDDGPSEVVVFPRLTYLKIEGCDQLMRAPSCHFPCLEELIIDGMESGLPLENICGVKLTTLTNLKIRGIKELECLPDALFSNNRNLSKVEISLPRLQLDGYCYWEGLNNNLVEIKLEGCSECEELPMLGHLPQLQSLYLSGFTNVKSIKPSFYGIDKCGNDISDNGSVLFPALKSLELVGMENLKEWDGLQPSEVVVVFPRLHYLKIKRCNQLTRAPSCHFPCLKKLEIDGMKSGLPLGNICGMKLTTLTHLDISRIEELECLPDELFSNNRNLSVLWIWDCPNMMHLVPLLILPGGGAPSLRILMINTCLSLRELPDDLHSLTSLEKLVIDRCPQLKSIPSSYPSSRGSGGQQQQEHQGLSSLKVLSIIGCAGLRNLPIEMLESCALSLETLRLEGLSSSLTQSNLSEVIGRCLHKMTRLTSLDIRGVPKFSIINSGIHQMVSSSSSLKCLDMGPSPSGSDSGSSWNNYVSFNETVDAMLLQFNTSLRKLRLRGMEHWECLPGGIQHRTSLRELELYDFGMEALPDWLGNLSSSLETLKLSFCDKIRHLPSKQAMQRLTKLTTLFISACPLLLKEERSNNNNNDNNNNNNDKKTSRLLRRLKELEKSRNNNSEPQQVVDSEWPKISHIPYILVNFRQYIHHGH